MLNFTHHLAIYVSVEPCDLRKSFDGLWAVAEQKLKIEPKSGALFVFTNKGRTRLKLLYWDGTGVWVLCKRLEKGTFRWPKLSESAATNEGKIKLTPEALALLTDGIELRDGGRRAWYERE